MTKYILHGGGVRDSADEGRTFFAEMGVDLGRNPKILLCFFAEPKQVWQRKYAEWRVRIAAFLPKQSVTYGLATVEDFTKQCESYDALYIYGGSTRRIIETFKQFGNRSELLGRFKAVAGQSAGALLLSKYGWDCTERTIVEGLNLVPVKTLVHYQSESYGADDPRGPVDWEKAWNELAAYDSPTIPIIELPEGQFEVYES